MDLAVLRQEVEFLAEGRHALRQVGEYVVFFDGVVGFEVVAEGGGGGEEGFGGRVGGEAVGGAGGVEEGVGCAEGGVLGGGGCWWERWGKRVGGWGGGSYEIFHCFGHAAIYGSFLLGHGSGGCFCHFESADGWRLGFGWGGEGGAAPGGKDSTPDKVQHVFIAVRPRIENHASSACLVRLADGPI